MSEFVVVDFKESEPYNIEEWRSILANSGDFQIEQPRLYSSLHQGVPRDLYFRFSYLLIKNSKGEKEYGFTLQMLKNSKKKMPKKEVIVKFLCAKADSIFHSNL